MTSSEIPGGRVQSQYRIPRDLHEWLRDEAVKQNRSLNAQLVHIVRQAKDASVK